jgi:hypothetical protein
MLQIHGVVTREDYWERTMAFHSSTSKGHQIQASYEYKKVCLFGFNSCELHYSANHIVLLFGMEL